MERRTRPSPRSSPGESVTLAESFTVPVPAPRSASETDAGYLARLLVLDGSPLIGSSFALAEGGVGRLVAPLVSATTTERLPVVSLTTTGPDSMSAGTTAQYDLGLANQGSAAAPILDLTATAAGVPLVVAGEPASLAAGELATATTTYTAPDQNPPADVTVAGEVTWSDAAGNDYGPVGSAQHHADPHGCDAVGDPRRHAPDRRRRRRPRLARRHGPLHDRDLEPRRPAADQRPRVDRARTRTRRSWSARWPPPAAPSRPATAPATPTVEVTYASIAGGSTVTFTFDVTVDDPFPAGASRLEVAGQVVGGRLRPGPRPTTRPCSARTIRPGRRSSSRSPTSIASLEGRLQLDPDGNGFPSAGDTLRYELIVASVGSLSANGVFVTVLDSHRDVGRGRLGHDVDRHCQRRLRRVRLDRQPAVPVRRHDPVRPAHRESRPIRPDCRQRPGHRRLGRAARRPHRRSAHHRGRGRDGHHDRRRKRRWRWHARRSRPDDRDGHAGRRHGHHRGCRHRHDAHAAQPARP